jgi:hypothetical protein
MRYRLKDQLVAADSPKPECEWGLERRAGYTVVYTITELVSNSINT